MRICDFSIRAKLEHWGQFMSVIDTHLRDTV